MTEQSEDPQIALSRMVAPKLDDRSREIFVSSGLFNLLYSSYAEAEPAVHFRDRHRDVTGFYQRNSGKRRNQR